MIEGRLEELPLLLQGVIEDERTLIAKLRDSGGNDELLVAAGRLQAWMMIHRHFTEYNGNLAKRERTMK